MESQYKSESDNEAKQSRKVMTLSETKDSRSVTRLSKHTNGRFYFICDVPTTFY